MTLESSADKETDTDEGNENLFVNHSMESGT